jgi:hypothetical protein
MSCFSKQLSSRPIRPIWVDLGDLAECQSPAADMDFATARSAGIAGASFRRSAEWVSGSAITAAAANPKRECSRQVFTTNLHLAI